jgi:RNA polymerase sigma factor (sigma-70 family)
MHVFKKHGNKQERSSGQEQGRLPDTVSDEALLAAIVDRDVGAMEVLYQRYHRVLYALAYRIVSDHQIAEDLLQECFLAVWRSASSYLPQSGKVQSWLFSIIHHRAIDYVRSLQRRSALNETALDEIDLDESAGSPDTWNEAWLSMQCAQVREALMSLRKEQRLVIELAYFQGWTHTEIAEGCHIPLGTVKARMRLGLLHLKRLLERKGIDGST